MPLIGRTRTSRLISAILSAKHDLAALAKENKLTPRQLANWIAEPEHQRLLQSLRTLADLQTQLLLSQYRLHATSRMLRIVADQETEHELARKAAVDLLKLDVAPEPVTQSNADKPMTQDEIDAELMRIYGRTSTPGNPGTPEGSHA
jgi:hypothetical protein